MPNKTIKQKKKTKLKPKTYAERAGYLSFINPKNKDFYWAIAHFFGENNYPPKNK